MMPDRPVLDSSERLDGRLSRADLTLILSSTLRCLGKAICSERLIILMTTGRRLTGKKKCRVICPAKPCFSPNTPIARSLRDISKWPASWRKFFYGHAGCRAHKEERRRSSSYELQIDLIPAPALEAARDSAKTQAFCAGDADLDAEVLTLDCPASRKSHGHRPLE